jgi:hypothetical protein
MVDFKHIFETLKTCITTNWEWSIIFLIIFIIVLRVLIRGYFWKTKKGDKLTFKQFMKRWKSGLEGITYMQQLKMQIWGIWVNFLGLALGIIVMSIARPKDLWWWLVIILGAGLFLNFVSFIGIYQKFKIQKRIDQTIKELNNVPLENEDYVNIIVDSEVQQGMSNYAIKSPYLKYK